MPKLTPVYVYTKSGERILSSYKTTFQKTEIEKHNLQDKRFKIKYKDSKIILEIEEGT